MRDQELARLFFRELEKIDQQEGTTPEKAEAMFQLWLQAIIERTQQERLHFTTLFARLAYAFQRYRIGRNLAYHLHDFRKCQKEGRWQYLEETEQEDRYQRYLLAVAQSFQAFYSASPTPYFVQLFEQPLPEYQLPDYIEGFRKSMRVLVVADDPEKDQLLGREEEAPEELVRIQYNMADRNENFNPGIQTLRRDFSLPLTVQLLDVEIDKNRVLRPRAILLEPDFLVDVSAIAECFKPEGADPIYFLLKKFLPINANKYLLLGNIANFFLDELMSRPEATFNETFGKVFHLSPLAFSLMENAEIREIMDKAKLHFVTLKQIIHQEFSQKEIAPEESFLEPTFYARRYGLQGRLDIFVPKGENPAIIELKSGKAYRPNQYGISSNHYTQTLLYDLMVRAVFKDQPDPINYILYSSLPEKPLRFAPRLASQQMEAMQLRNLLIGIETQLASSYANDPETPLEDSPAARLLRRIHSGFYPQLKGFTMRDIQRFAEAYSSLSRIEQNYFLAFAGFIAREHRLAKTGQEGAGKVSGQAALWLNSPEEKEDAFEILQHLQLKENHAQETVPLLVFHKDPERTNPLANFRTGDIAILYPKPATGDGPLHNHLFKCTLLENTSEKIVVRLRYQQFNDSLFTEDSEWCLEHDVLDSSFNTMYRSLFAFAEGTTEKRELLLGLVPPEEGPAVKIEVPAGMTSEQGSILQKMLATKDYFLLWGPPGTGKTSVMLRNLVEQLLADPKESILVMAYTNRAVDEICESIERISPDIKDQYLRIGSSFSAGAQFQEQMLDRKIANVRSRKEIRELLNRHRLFVGTVSSIAARPELLQLKTFSWAIIDEASQILEPALAGLLVHFQRFILIGDHQQLPAVVQQPEQESAVEDKHLQQIGLNNLRNSLFERLYKLACRENWDWAYAQLSHQGRMHQEIMDFPNLHFYQDRLAILPSEIPHHQQQIAPLELNLPDEGEPLFDVLAKKRLIFLPSRSASETANFKTNIHEAQLITRLVRQFQQLYQFNGKETELNQIGIITPYRAQIAQIRDTLQQAGINPDQLTIDTVERYQGGSRDIILISLCTNSLSQLHSLVSLSDEGVDRKLNVALTRAREHVVIVGNPDLLNQNPTYRSLIEYGKVELPL